MTQTATLTESLTYAQLVAKIQASELKKGASYTITDYATAHYILDGTGDVIYNELMSKIVHIGDNEPITVTALNSNKLSREAKSSLYLNDVIYYDWNPENWKYDLAFSASDESVLSDFKGVIYFRHDTINDVSMGYDWRSVVNRRWKKNYDVYNPIVTYIKGDIVQASGDGIYVSMSDSNTGFALNNTLYWMKIVDYGITEYLCHRLDEAQDAGDFIDVKCFHSQDIDPDTQYVREVRNIKLSRDCDSIANWAWWGTGSILANNVFFLKPNEGYVHILNCYFGNDCRNNTFSGSVSGCVMGNSFSNNVIIGTLTMSTIGNGFSSNIIGSGFSQNTIGNGFYSNIIAPGFSYNTVCNAISLNKICVVFQKNTIFDSFSQYEMFSSSHSGTGYNCEFFISQGGGKKVKYVNNSGELVIVDADA